MLATTPERWYTEELLESLEFVKIWRELWFMC